MRQLTGFAGMHPRFASGGGKAAAPPPVHPEYRNYVKKNKYLVRPTQRTAGPIQHASP